MRVAVCLMLFVFFAASAHGQDAAVPVAAQTAAQEYSDQLTQLSEGVNDEIAAAISKYSLQLDELIKSRQAAGDLNSVVALRAEKDKIGKGDLSKSEKLPPIVSKARNAMDGTIKKVTVAHENKVKATQKAFSEQLEELEKSETKAGNIESALAIQKYRLEQVKAPAKSEPDVASRIGRTFTWRFGAEKEQLLKDGGGTPETEAAVQRGLAFLASTVSAERPADGQVIWTFLWAGNTHRHGKYQALVRQSLESLQKRPRTAFDIGGNRVELPRGLLIYAEIYGMTGDPAFKQLAMQAIEEFEQKQLPEGRWAGAATFQVVLTLLELRTAQLAGLPVKPETLERVGRFLDTVASEDKSMYGEVPGKPISDKPVATPLAHVARMYCNQWKSDHPSLKRGAQLMLQYQPTLHEWGITNRFYMWEDGAQLMYARGGDDWKSKWNPAMQKYLLSLQVPEGQPMAGAFIAPDVDRSKLTPTSTQTSAAVSALQVYYRFPPETYDGTR